MSSYEAQIVVDLGFGDAGKGTIIDFLARLKPNSTVVRFNGGGQAAHNVVTPDGRHHTFAQFGSGTFVPAVRTHLSGKVVVDPVTLIAEEEHLRTVGVTDAFSRLTIDENALVVTHYQKIVNRIREILRGDAKHGSCGMGIGETMADALAAPDPPAIRVRDLRDWEVLRSKLYFLRARMVQNLLEHTERIVAHEELRGMMDLLASPTYLDEVHDKLWRSAMRFKIVSGNYLRVLADRGHLLFEGAQGVLLDEWYGFHPYTTWSTTTCENARTLLNDIHYTGRVERIGVLRAYAVRHGAGPFPTEDATMTKALPDTENVEGRWQGPLRVGHFDAVLTRYALAVCGGVDSLAITNLDRGIEQRSFVDEYWDKSANGYISMLPIKAQREDLAFQEQLSKRLAQMEPVVLPLPGGNKEFLWRVREALNIPVTITSYGPKATHKMQRK